MKKIALFMAAVLTAVFLFGEVSYINRNIIQPDTMFSEIIKGSFSESFRRIKVSNIIDALIRQPIGFKLTLKGPNQGYAWGGQTWIRDFKGISDEDLAALGKDNPGDAIAESWEVTAVAGSVSVISGLPQGIQMNLLELLQKKGREILGDRLYEKFGEQFPVLMKFLDCNSYLSVQSHPLEATPRYLLASDSKITPEQRRISGDARYSKTGEGYVLDPSGDYLQILDMPKTESWVVLGANPGAKIYLGFNKEFAGEDGIVTPEEIQEKMDELKTTGAPFIDIDSKYIDAKTKELGEDRVRFLKEELGLAAIGRIRRDGVITNKEGASLTDDKLVSLLKALGEYNPDAGEILRKQEEIMDSFLNGIVVNPGDVFIVPSGTIHALGSGVKVAEIQQSSGSTYRLFDWNSNRPIDPDSVKATVRREGTSREDYLTAAGIFGQTGAANIMPDEAFRRFGLSASDFFSFDLVNVDSNVPVVSNTSDGFHVITAIEGNLTIKYGNGETQELRRGYSVLIPASVGVYSLQAISGNARIIKIFVPLGYLPKDTDVLSE